MSSQGGEDFRLHCKLIGTVCKEPMVHALVVMCQYLGVDEENHGERESSEHGYAEGGEHGWPHRKETKKYDEGRQEQAFAEIHYTEKYLGQHEIWDPDTDDKWE